MRMRKKRCGGERLLALSSLFLSEDECSGDISASFDASRPLRLEIGCGKGEFIRALSRRDKDYNYIALERVRDVIVAAAEKYAQDRGLGCLDFNGGWRAPDGNVYKGGRVWDIPMEARGNVRFFYADASLAEKCFPDGVFQTIYANFSDPWTKNGHASRRLTHPTFLKSYLRLLCPGGLFCFKTDNDELFDFSLDAVQNEPGFEVTFVTRDLHGSSRAADNIVTEYEQNFSNQGIPIKFLEARKK